MTGIATIEEQLKQAGGLLVGADRRGLWVTTEGHLRRFHEVAYLTLRRGGGTHVRFARRHANWREALVYGAHASVGFGVPVFACLVSGPLLFFAAFGGLPWTVALGVSAVCWAFAWFESGVFLRRDGFVATEVRDGREMIREEIARALERSQL